jgi:hypothetical protein
MNKPDIVLESSLLQAIRSDMYNLSKKPQMPGSVEVTAANRLEYTVLRAFLSGKARRHFLTLFPQFAERFERFRRTFDRLASTVVDQLRQRQSARPPSTTPPSARRIEVLAGYLASHIRSRSDLNPSDPDSLSIIADFIFDTRYLDLYFSYLVAPTATPAAPAPATAPPSQ